VRRKLEHDGIWRRRLRAAKRPVFLDWSGGTLEDDLDHRVRTHLGWMRRDCSQRHRDADADNSHR
jgi:hypothetical protein